ncbi:hypothetical protein AB1Y20_012750 [Prymnesium parvum]|uniref:Uncharacterized protein n=1 Tax=Prymnesium parvum TaxID=97485 RepID=A0AB34IL73_PRYPA
MLQGALESVALPCLRTPPRVHHKPMILLLMDGGNDAVGSLPAELLAIGVIVVAMDINRPGYPVQDVLSARAMAEKWHGLTRGDFQGAAGRRRGGGRRRPRNGRRAGATGTARSAGGGNAHDAVLLPPAPPRGAAPPPGGGGDEQPGVAQRVVDVGAPFGAVRLQDDHALAGVRVTVPNSVWEPHAAGRVRCVIIGCAPDVRMADGQHVFVVRCPDAQHAYAFASGVLAALLPRAHARLLPARQSRRLRQATTLAARPASAAAGRLRARQGNTRRSTAAKPSRLSLGCLQSATGDLLRHVRMVRAKVRVPTDLRAPLEIAVRVVRPLSSKRVSASEPARVLPHLRPHPSTLWALEGAAFSLSAPVTRSPALPRACVSCGASCGRLASAIALRASLLRQRLAGTLGVDDLSRAAICCGALAVAGQGSRELRVWDLERLDAVPYSLLSASFPVECLAAVSVGPGVSLVAAAGQECLCIWEVCSVATSPPAVVCERRLPLVDVAGSREREIRDASFDASGCRLVLCVGSEAWLVECPAASSAPLHLTARLHAHEAPLAHSRFAPHFWACLLERHDDSEVDDDVMLNVAWDRSFSLWQLPPADAPSRAIPAALLQATLPAGGSPPTSSTMHPSLPQLVMGDASGRLYVLQARPCSLCGATHATPPHTRRHWPLQVRQAGVGAASALACSFTHTLELSLLLRRIGGASAAAPVVAEDSRAPVFVSTLPPWRQPQPEERRAQKPAEGAVELACEAIALQYVPLAPSAGGAPLGEVAEWPEGAAAADGFGLLVLTQGRTVLLRASSWQPEDTFSVQGGDETIASDGAISCEDEARLDGSSRWLVWCISSSGTEPREPAPRLPPERTRAESSGNAAGMEQQLAHKLSIFSTDAPLPHSPLAIAIAASGAPPRHGGGAERRRSAGKGAGRAASKPADQPVMFHKKVTSSGYGAPPVMALHAGGPSAAKAAAARARSAATGRGGLRRPTPARGAMRYPQQVNNSAAPHLGAPALRLAFSPDATRLAVATADGAVALVRLPTRRSAGRKVPSLVGHNAALSSVQWSHSGRLLLTASADGSAAMWDVWHDHPPSTPLLHFARVRHSPGMLLSEHRPAKESTNPPFDAEVRQAGFYYLDQFVLLASGNGLHLYSYSLQRTPTDDANRAAELRHKYRLQYRWAHPQAHGITCFSAANSFLSPVVLLGGSDRSVNVLNLATGQQVTSIPDAHERQVHMVRLFENSAYENTPLSSHELFLTAAVDGVVKLWDLRVATCVRRFGAHTNRLHAIGASVSPCLRYVCCGSEDKVAYLYDAGSGGLVEKLAGHTDTVTDVSFNPLHPQLATTSLDGSMRFFADAPEAS